ncbi:hypothetical protein [Schinkia azotoformans]|nr:hypothetical protein [Schinkia azotoformans]MEC1772820.1 hypothetical protein [Schinkia azotoformans]MED4367461.1 hypothetical protein [Schinkia azotoformans]
MIKVINEGIYCGKCKQFIRQDIVPDWECPCFAEEWEDAKIVLVTDEESD